jgi:exopolysaccharide biosynthesis polyprenyl glycosylphosphotransferase
VVLRATGALPPDFAAWLLAWAAISVIGLVLAREALRRRGLMPRVLVLGAEAACSALVEAYSARQPGAWRLAGCLDDEAPDALGRIAGAVEDGRANVLVVAAGEGSQARRCRRLCAALADQPVAIRLAVPHTALGAEGLHQAGDFALLELHASPQAGTAAAAKRLFDLSCCAAALLALAPLLLLIALAIRLESPGSVLFRQWRFGLGNRPIQVLKFRTMRLDGCDPSGARRTLQRDPRVTAVGRVLRRTSLDELPQLLNVLRGDMSLVGPRPHPLHMRVGDAYYFDAVEGYATRHLVPPGITGWAQINGSRGEVDTLAKARRRLELDLWYIRHWSLALDLWILLRTALGGFASPRAD